jgi:hypothetical protein
MDQLCRDCNLSTKPGSGKWVNRIPGVDENDQEYWICEECDNKERMSSQKPRITTIEFPDGVFDYIWCLIGMQDEGIVVSTYEAFVGIGVKVNVIDCSPEYLKFDETRVFNYAQDLDEFFDWYNNGGWDFKILDYEKDVVEDVL